MKRIWIAILLISLAVGLCVYEQYEVREFCNTMESLAQSEDLSGIKDYWRKHNDKIYIFSSHDMLDEIAKSVEMLSDEKNSDTKNALNELRAFVKSYYENQKLSPSNIF